VAERYFDGAHIDAVSGEDGQGFGFVGFHLELAVVLANEGWELDVDLANESRIVSNLLQEWLQLVAEWSFATGVLALAAGEPEQTLVVEHRAGFFMG
jgi:hypothetical protein